MIGEVRVTMTIRTEAFEDGEELADFFKPALDGVVKAIGDALCRVSPDSNPYVICEAEILAEKVGEKRGGDKNAEAGDARKNRAGTQSA